MALPFHPYDHTVITLWRLDTHHSHVGKYEHGEAVPSFEVVQKIADALEVSLDYLVGEGVNNE